MTSRNTKTRLVEQLLLFLGIAFWLLCAGCTHVNRTVPPQRPYGHQLFQVLKCDAHIIENWRNLNSRRFRGRVVIKSTDPPQPFPGALVAIRKTGADEVQEVLADEIGYFDVGPLQEGVYEFVACSPGMDPDIGWVTISRRSYQTQVTLILRFGV